MHINHNTGIDQINLTHSTIQCLRNVGIHTIGDVVGFIQSENDFKKIPNLNIRAEELYVKLEKVGIDLFLNRNIKEEIFAEKLRIKLDELPLSSGCITKLADAGVKYVEDIMRELVNYTDIIRLGLSDEEINEVSRAMENIGVGLGIFEESIAAMGFYGDIKEKIAARYKTIEDILSEGLMGLLHDFSEEESLRIGRKLRKMGYLLEGFPWEGNKDVCVRLRNYFRKSDISILGLSSESERRLKLGMGERLNVGRLARYSSGSIYYLTQDYESCEKIAVQLRKMYFPENRVAESLGKCEEDFLANNTSRMTSLEKLDLSLKVIQTLKKHGIKTVEDLINTTASDLYKRGIAKDSALASIREVLSKGGLLLKDDYVIKCKHCGVRYVSNEIDNQLCSECIARERRIQKAGVLQISLTGPDYGSYTNLSSGFTLFAHIKNISKKVQKIKLVDFYVVEKDKQIVPKYFLTGYFFDNEAIIPNSVKSIGKIWDTNNFEYSTMLSADAYVMLTVKVEGEKDNRVYKFVQDRDEEWSLFDVYKL